MTPTIRTTTCVIAAFAAIHLALPYNVAAQIHTPNDHIPNFAASPTIRSARAGNWSSATTWNPARVPLPSDIVSVEHAVTYDSVTGDADVIGIQAGGALQFTTSQTTRLRVGTLVVLQNGTLEIGTAADPIAASVIAEILIKDHALNAATDPDQYGTGLLSIDGSVTMHGGIKSPTFVRTATEPRAGDTTLILSQAVTGWRAGDRIFLPDTRQVPADHWFNQNFPLQIEERIIQSVSSDGRTITLASPLSFDHRGARDADGTPTVVAGIPLRPHVGNLTRNVIIRSANPAGIRGHTLYTHRSTVSISYVQFQDLGRTRAVPLNASSNHIGRYPLHIHHLWGPPNSGNVGYQFLILGNAVNDSLKWPIAVHGSHYGHIKQNVVFGGAQLTGAGIAVEDGTETENLFEENFVANIRGSINPRESGPGSADGLTPGSAAECFWAAGFNNRFVNNVASSCRNPVQQIVSGPGWKFIVPAAPYTARNPKFRGADMADVNQTIAVTPQHQPILEFRGNEVYGLAADGLTAWELGTDGYGIIPPTMGESLIKDFRVWHTYEGAIYNYPAHRMTVDGLVYRVDPAATQYWPAAFQCGDYRNIDITIRGGTIHAGAIFGGCTDPLGNYRFENIDAVTHGHAFTFETPATPGTGADRPATGVTMVLRNNAIRPWPGRALQTVDMMHTLTRGNSQPNDKYEIFVYNYQGQNGNNFRVYFRQQANQNLYGGPAPCNNTTARPEIDGITCPMVGAPPGAPSAPRGVRIHD
jgi:G8 domain